MGGAGGGGQCAELRQAGEAGVGDHVGSLGRRPSALIRVAGRVAQDEPERQRGGGGQDSEQQKRKMTTFTVGILALVSLVVGWLVAGRILRPIHRITATAQRLSLSTLHERIALTGPKELADTFDAMLDRLERSVEGQRRFIANASHELRTPLAVQRAAIEIGLPEDVPEIRGTLLRHNRRAEKIIDALLVLAQAEHGLDNRSPVALDQVIWLVLAERSSDGVTVTAKAKPFVVDGDPVLLNRLVTNLLDNAVRYNHPGGTVEVTLSRGVLTVRNTGPHVPRERFGDLFEPFRRLQMTRGQGAGLGLSIVAAIAKAHGADVRANPNPGGGLELVVVFAGSDDAMPATDDSSHC